MKSRRVLVTGGAGVIGRELLALLSDAGETALSVDEKPLGRDMPGVTHLVKDLSTDGLEEIKEFAPDTIFHLAAAFERSKESAKFFPVNWRNNVLLSHRMVELAQEAACVKTFVFASSYLIYSPALYTSSSLRDETVYLNEEDLVAPRNLTGAAKHYTEIELDFLRLYVKPSLRPIHARIFRVYGRGSKDVVSRWVRDALGGGGLEVYNAENRFDYIYAGDAAEGLMRLAACEVACGVVNLGSGTGRGVKEVVAAVRGLSPDAGFKDLGVTEDFEQSAADMTRFKKLTGWMPPTTLEEGIRKVFEYESRRMR
jgi:nucleoside-diphosphate-sugar epimerase